MIKKLKSALKSKNTQRIGTAIKKIKKSTSPEYLLEATYHLLKEGSGHEEIALEFLDKAISLNPLYADKAHALVREPFLKGNDEFNEKVLLIGLKYNADEFSNNIELALICIRSEEFERAEKCLLRALHTDSSRYEPLVNLTDLYLKMNRYHDAYACAQLAIEVSPNPELAHYNAGVIAMMTARYKEALLSFEKVLQLNPEHDDARISFGQLLLKAGNFQLGWPQMEYRWNVQQKINNINLPLPLWQGEPLKDKGLIVWADQGLGDSIMYASLLNRIVDAGCRLSLICIDRLERLFTASFDLEKYYSHGNCETVNIAGHYHYQISFGSLPAMFIHSFDDFSDGAPYLIADSDKEAVFRQSLHNQFPDKKLIGFTWRGGLSHTRKYARDTGLDIWRPLMENDDSQFICLQYDITDEDKEKIVDMNGFVSELDCKNDLDGLAALIKSLDLVISADNTTVHLAGALGVPVWTLLPFASEWRWFFEEEKTYWYKSMRLFHQQKLNEWQECFGIVEKEFVTYLAKSQ